MKLLTRQARIPGRGKRFPLTAFGLVIGIIILFIGFLIGLTALTYLLLS